MNIRDLKPHDLRRLAVEADDEYSKWLSTTEGLSFGTHDPVPQKQLWRLAFSKGCSAVLRRVDQLKPQ